MRRSQHIFIVTFFTYFIDNFYDLLYNIINSLCYGVKWI